MKRIAANARERTKLDKIMNTCNFTNAIHYLEVSTNTTIFVLTQYRCPPLKEKVLRFQSKPCSE